MSRCTEVTEENWETAGAVLRLASQLIDGVQEGLARRGFTDVRPAHGFAFVRISAGDARTADVAEHLGVTKQAAAELTSQLIALGYVTRQPDPSDGRAQLLLLTDRGWACTDAAQAAARETVDQWKSELRAADFDRFQDVLRTITRPGRLRPSW
jgi:DNA-binding MarR family transcriptional regulator